MKDKNIIVKLTVGLFAVIGFIFIIVGIIWLVSGRRFVQSAVKVSAVISEIESYRDSDENVNYRVYVNYSYGGQRYEDIRLNEYSSSMYEGKEIQVMLDPDNPKKLMTNLGLYIGPAVFIGMGAIFTSAGVISLVGMGRKSSAKKKLIASGQYIYGTVESIEYDKSYILNGKHPFVVYCTYRDDYKDIVYRFKSDNIWTNPEYVIKPGSEIRIFVDHQNYKNYHVDIESILQGKIVDYT